MSYVIISPSRCAGELPYCKMCDDFCSEKDGKEGKESYRNQIELPAGKSR